MSLTGADVLAASKRRVFPLVLEELGGLTVYVLTLSGADLAALEASLEADKKLNKSRFFERVALTVLGDEDGNRLFTDADLPKIEQLDSVVLRKIHHLADEVNGLSPSSMEARIKNLPRSQDS